LEISDLKEKKSVRTYSALKSSKAIEFKNEFKRLKVENRSFRIENLVTIYPLLR
jgi:hypothetical protein